MAVAPQLLKVATDTQKNDFVLVTSTATVASGATGVMFYTVSGLNTTDHMMVDVGQYAWSSLSGVFSQVQSGSIDVTNAWVASASTLAIAFYNGGASQAPALGYYNYIVW